MKLKLMPAEAIVDRRFSKGGSTDIFKGGTMNGRLSLIHVERRVAYLIETGGVGASFASHLLALRIR